MSQIFNISRGTDDAKRLFDGVDKAADVICSTMGACGSNHIIDLQNGFLIHKDGVTAARHIHFDDPLEDLGAKLLIDAAYTTVKNCGDGTTGTTAILRHLLQEILLNDSKSLSISGLNKHLIANGMSKAVVVVEKWLHDNKERISEDLELAKIQLGRIGTISANNNEEIGSKVGHLIAECGRNAIISVIDSHDSEVRFEKKDGYVFDAGWVTPHFVNAKNGSCAFSESLVCIVNEKLSSDEDVIQIMTHWRDVNETIMENVGENIKSMAPDVFSMKAMPLVIVCQDIEGDALNTLLANLPQNVKQGGYVKSVVIRMPLGGERRDDLVSDLQVITGTGRIIDSMRGQLKSSFGKSNEGVYGEFGYVRNIEAYKGKTNFGHFGTGDVISKRIEGLRSIDLGGLDSSVIDFISERIARLTGGIGTISVGATTETEQKQLKLLVDDAQLACLSAYKNGFVVGGGAALYKFSEYVGIDTTEMGKEETIGTIIVLSALCAPLNTMWSNYDPDGSISDIISHDMFRKELFSVVDMISLDQLDGTQRSVIDPVDVPIQSLKNAVSVAAKILTSKYVTI